MELHVGVFLSLFFAAIGIGGLSSILGVGGGIFMVPLLMLAGFVPSIQQAAGTSIAGVFFTSMSSTIAYASRGVINVRIGLILMPTTVFGAWCGARLTSVINARWLAIAFGLLLLYPVAMMLRGRQPKDISHAPHNKAQGIKLYVTCAILGMAAGTASGMFGIGGGTVMVPALAVLLGFDIVTAAATSLFVMLPSAAMGSYQHWVQGDLRPELALPLILGIVIGSQIGPRVSSRIPKRRLRQLFGIVLLYAAANMILKGIR